MQFKDKVVLITGAAGGIGLATARQFAAEGAKLALVDLSSEALEKATADISGSPLLIAANVADEADAEAYVQSTLDRYGRIDVFFNNAGINGDFKPITEQTLENYQRVLNVNVIGAFLGLKYVLRAMQGQKSGVVVNTGSNGGTLGAPNMSAYVASKHALLGLNKTAALEAAPFGIRVNAIAPSGVDTAMIRSIETNAAKGNEEEIRRKFHEAVPLGRYATADEIANLVLFLASDKAAFISGAYYRIDGGGAAMSA
jgi:3-hydroxybutyrate dehydrogenase